MQAHLKAAPANANPKLLKELAKPTQEKKKFYKMPHRTTKRQMRVSKTGHTNLVRQESTGGNSTYPKGGVLCSKDSFVVDQTLVFQIKFCGKSPALRVAANRYASP